MDLPSVDHATSVVEPVPIGLHPSCKDEVAELGIEIGDRLDDRDVEAEEGGPPVLFAQIVYSVRVEFTDGIPAMLPLLGSRFNPSGRAGETSHVSTTPPLLVIRICGSATPLVPLRSSLATERSPAGSRTVIVTSTKALPPVLLA